MTRVSDEMVFAAKIIKREKLEENKYKDKFVVERMRGEKERFNEMMINGLFVCGLEGDARERV